MKQSTLYVAYVFTKSPKNLQIDQGDRLPRGKEDLGFQRENRLSGEKDQVAFKKSGRTEQPGF